MSRDLSAGMVTEVTAQALRPIMLVYFEFDGGDIRLWSGVGDLLWGSDTFTGAGSLMGLSPYEENQALQAQGITVTVSGISSSILSIALAEPYQGRPATIWLGALDSAGVLISDPYQIFTGFMDVMSITEGGENCDVSVSIENKMITITKTKESRYTGEDQKRKYSGDLGLDFVAFLQDKEIVWKAAS